MLKLQAVPSETNHSSPIDTLTNSCNGCVDKCHQILESITGSVFADENPTGSSSVGAHVRHIIERFNCFLVGYPLGQINYDLRKRDRTLERDLDRARTALSVIVSELSNLRDAKVQHLQVVESVDEHCPAVAVESTVERELMGLVSHTTHHLAIIVMIVKAHGLSLSEELGKAPSTIIYERQN
jgi:hypothetical protein